MLENFAGFNIEPTNLCTLKCPKCARTMFMEQYGTKNWENHNLNLDDLKRFIDVDVTGKKFILCGNYGDALYYKDLFPLIEWIKNSGAKIELVTNGSYKTQTWWADLVSLLDSQDMICFSIDGTPDNFTKYRVNGDWESIEVGIKEVVGKVKTVWKYIPFNYNQNSIEQARGLSDSLGIDDFILTPSWRWEGEDDSLMPTEHVIRRYDFIKNPDKTEIHPICKKTNHEHFISATGFYTPCCPASDYRVYYKSEFYKNKNKYDISKTSFSTILADMKDFFKNIEQAKHTVCITQCSTKITE
jgi:MoaA/NifB/PqqE/SkfB family radical SAM enzyme